MKRNDVPTAKKRPIARRIVKRVALALAWTALAIAIVWATAALWYDSSRLRWLAGLLSISFAGGCVALLVFLRPLRRGLAATLSLLLLVMIWWNLIPPRNDRDWQPDVARLAHAAIEGNRLTITNVRNFDYRGQTDFTGHWETRSYDLDKLQGVDMFLCYWGRLAPLPGAEPEQG